MLTFNLIKIAFTLLWQKKCNHFLSLLHHSNTPFFFLLSDVGLCFVGCIVTGPNQLPVFQIQCLHNNNSLIRGWILEINSLQEPQFHPKQCSRISQIIKSLPMRCKFRLQPMVSQNPPKNCNS